MPTALPFMLSDLNHRLFGRDDACADGPVLLIFVERDCPTSAMTVRAVARTGARAVLICEGRSEAAEDFVAVTGAHELTTLVQLAPYNVSLDYGVLTVPTTILLDGSGEEVSRVQGWDVRSVAAMVKAAEGSIHEFGHALPDHKPGCGSRSTYDPEMQRSQESLDRELGGDGIDEMWERGWTDGLPVVPPSRARVDSMLAGRDPDIFLGSVPPALGELNMERLAASAVMAGCSPAYFPVVIAATEAILQPEFNLHGLQNSTHVAAPTVIVNGPIRAAIGMNARSNVFGFGNRANATIGRTLRLIMCLTGGAAAGRLDQSTFGGPHKFGLCFPENEEDSPWPPLHVRRGFPADTSSVTVVATEGPSQISDHFSKTPEQLANTLTHTMQGVMAATWYPLGAETVLAVGPEHAHMLSKGGWTCDNLRDWIFAHARRTAGEIRHSGSGEHNAFVGLSEDDSVVLGKFVVPEEIVIVVAGGVGRFSAVLGPWVGATLGGAAMITRTIDGSC